MKIKIDKKDYLSVLHRKAIHFMLESNQKSCHSGQYNFWIEEVEGGYNLLEQDLCYRTTPWKYERNSKGKLVPFRRKNQGIYKVAFFTVTE